MNSLFVAGIAVFLLLLGYIFYSRKVKEWVGLALTMYLLNTGPFSSGTISPLSQGRRR